MPTPVLDRPLLFIAPTAPRASAAPAARPAFTVSVCWLASFAAHLGILIGAGLLLGSMPRGNSLMPHTFETTLGEMGGGDGGFQLGSAGAGLLGKSEPPQPEVSPPEPPQPDPVPTSPQPVADLPPQPTLPEEPTGPASRAPLNVTVQSGGQTRSTFAGRRAGSSGGAGGGVGGQFGPGSGGSSLFGIPTEGSKVVYVFDRSTSMGGGLRSPLSLAKAELLASLDELAETDQFQIVFYNSGPTPFTLPNQPARLLRATSQHKNLARSYVGSIIADGGTGHEEALALALRMGPDTIFFLTDADEPVLNPGQLERLSRLNRRHIVIHAVEFGRGPSLGDNNFLVRIAQQNYGKYTYVDVTRPELYPPTQ